MAWDFDIAAPRQAVWEHFTVPGQRQKWWPADAVIEHSGNKRRGVGTENHCMHVRTQSWKSCWIGARRIILP
jgi:uncharacterized protein YndB with AHSA1/START domain